MHSRMTTQDLDRITRDTVTLIKNKMAFVKNWANSVAMKARENARGKGGRRWWRELARSIWVKSVSETEVDVGTDHVGAGLKQHGGEVRPVNSKALTIPIAEEAKGKRAYEFERADRELFVISQKTGDPQTIGILGYAEDGGREGAVHPLYVLRTKADMKPDPWFPGNGEISVLAQRESLRQLAKEQAVWNR